MKRGLKTFLIVSVISLIFLAGSVDGVFELGGDEESYSLGSVYSPSENINGWLNISFKDEFYDSLISSSTGDSIILIDFLEQNSADYECTPANCGDDYTSTNGQEIKSFSLGISDEKTLSFFIGEGNINSIKEIKFGITVSNMPSCINPLKIDVLNDGVTEWVSDKVLNVFTCQYGSGTGCFDSSASSSNVLIDETPFCGKIKLIENSNFSLGAWVKKGTTPWYDGLLKMELYGLDGVLLTSCNLPQPTTSGGEIRCVIKQNNKGVKEYYVCIKADTGKSTDYKIKKEETEPCGFYAFPGSQTEYHDYYIFARAARFANIGEALFDQIAYESQGNSGLLKDYILNYLDEKYNKDCSNGCSIPITFKSYGNLSMFVLNATLDYTTGAGPQIPKHLIYDTSLKKAKINSDFQIFDLSKGNLSAPSEIGEHLFEFKLNDEVIFEKEINVIAIPSVADIIPNNVPALVPVKFTALLNSSSNLTYVWNFGDNTPEQTSAKNTVEHTYSEIGNYQLRVVVKNAFGNSTKTIQVTVNSPKEQINKTIQDYMNKLSGIESEINKLSGWVKAEIEKKIGIEEIKTEIKVQEDKYADAFSDQDYIQIMGDLMQIEIPDSFAVSQSISSSQIFPSENQMNLDGLSYFGAGNIEKDSENYAIAISNWVRENIDITFESKTYSLYSDGVEEQLYSYVKVTLVPKQDLGEVYFLINGNADETKFGGSYTVKKYDGEDSGVVFSELKDSKIIEFLYPKKISAGNLPVYLSPSFSSLELDFEPEICNFNKRCEKDLGENYNNCRNDCKPLGWTIFWFIILLFTAFVVYIILQEWYKRYYESHLFKSKNQLFNLVNFMNNAENQGIKKSKIFSNLKDVGWSGEQLTYAWNKLHGKRTGMWEIPIFKWVERRQVKKELEKRKSASVSLKTLGKV